MGTEPRTPPPSHDDDDGPRLRVRITTHRTLEANTDNDDDDFLTGYDATVLAEDTVVASCDGWIVHVDAMEALSLGIVDTCDQYNQTLYDFAASLFDSERDIPNRATHKALGCNLERVDDGWAIENCNFLIVDRMTVDVGYQGKGLGLRLLKHVFDTLGGSCGSAAMEPFPI